MRRLGLRLFSLATLVQLAAGLWLLLSLPGRVRRVFLGDDPGDTALLWTSVLLALVSLAVVRRHLLAGAGLVGAAVLGMAIVRHRVREASLAPHFSTTTLGVESQTAPFVLFLVLFLAGIAVVAWMVGRLARAAEPKAGG